MKKNVLFMIAILTILCVCISSCTTQDNEAISRSALDATSSVVNKQNFWHTFDSINTAYSNTNAMIATRVDSKPVITGELTTIKQKNFIGGKVADQLGKVAGGWCGKWAGGALGSLTGNPAITVFGVWSGRRVGQVAGAIVCSYLAEKYLCEKKGYSLTTFSILNPIGDIYINEDSMGVVHNKILSKLTKQSNKYGTTNINYDLIYNDCIQLLKEEGIYNDTIATDSVYRKDLIGYCKEVSQLATSCYEGKISGEELLDTGANSLKEEFNVCDEDITELKNMCTSITNTSNKKNCQEMQNYANALSAAIKNANGLNKNEKANISSFVSVAMSSSAYWDNLEKQMNKQ